MHIVFYSIGVSSISHGTFIFIGLGWSIPELEAWKPRNKVLESVTTRTKLTRFRRVPAVGPRVLAVGLLGLQRPPASRVSLTVRQLVFGQIDLSAVLIFMSGLRIG